MSTPHPKRTIYDDPMERELKRWPGVTWRREVRSKHYVMVLQFEDRTRLHVYPGTPSDAYKGQLAQITDLRKSLKALGAVRLAEPKATAPRKRRNRTEPTVVRLGERAEHDPSRDEFAKLRKFRKLLVDATPFVLAIRAGKRSVA